MASTPLSARLRNLRLSGWGNGPIKQTRLAEALGVTAPSISSYESGSAAPPPERLRTYALFFACARWMDRAAPRRVTETFLTDEERAAAENLLTELTHLATGNGSSAFWRFPDGGPVRILCGQLDVEQAGQHANVDDYNYMYLRNAADLDSLVELWGHIRRLNPDADVQYRLGDSFSSGDLQCHVVVLGNIARMQGGRRLLTDRTLQVQQVPVPNFDGEVFEVHRSAGEPVRFEPIIENGRVIEDVGLIARVPNPNYMERTFTICSGVFTRGVYGAVRCLTDKGLRDKNAEYLSTAFPDLSTFGLLMKVGLSGNAVLTPDLRNPQTRLFEIRPLPT